ncbi:uncharacterized protein ARMOST_18861 [Armillaria ostoyae]|uniref:DUF6534 domain-containing protein n=1 Tax=Armillaria ostoyae TaxID=47428 RepID=A0A284S2X7_ARMOS|nr:uncharacterized protein ARMOST_18861 [Armillaria ostoyae]
MSLRPPTIPSLGDTFGALFVSATIAAILFGVMNLQVLIYYKTYPNDWSLYRRAIALFWSAEFIRTYRSWRTNVFFNRVLDTVHVALSTHALYYYLINMYGNLLGALEGNIIWSMRLQLLVKTIVFVQGVYAIRLWKLGRHFHKVVPWLVFLAVAALFGNSAALLVSFMFTIYASHLISGAGIFLSYDIYVTPNLASVSIINTSIYTLYSMIIMADLVISLITCYYLHKSRAAMYFSSMADLLLDLIRLVVISGLATSACSLFSLFTVCLSQFEALQRSHEDLQYIMWPKTFIFVAIDFILPRLYINSLLAMFNYRHRDSSNKSVTEHIRHSIPTTLRFAPNTAEDHTIDTSVSLPLSDIQGTRSSGKLGISKGVDDSTISV